MLCRSIGQINNLVDLRFGDNERRGKIKNVFVWHRSCNEPSIASCLGDAGDHLKLRIELSLRLAIGDEFDRAKQPNASHLTDDFEL